MTATNTPTQYWLCVSTYHGFDKRLILNGDTVAITTTPIYSDEALRTIYNDWGCAQHGPFSTIEEARQEMVRLYGPCREIDDIDEQHWKTEASWGFETVTDEVCMGEQNPAIIESYAIGEYECLTKEQTEDVIGDYTPSPNATDEEIAKEAEDTLGWLHSEHGEHSDYIEEVLLENREIAREKTGYYDNEDED